MQQKWIEETREVSGSRLKDALAAALASPLWSGLLALLVYALAATRHGSLTGISEYPYYNYLADAFLRGQLDLRLTPPNLHDLVIFEDRYFLYWPPLPALLLMPFVALFGVHFSDIAFTVGVGALNVALAAALLRQLDQRAILPLNPAQRAALVLFFAFGSVHFVLAPRGRVWFTGQLVGLTFVLLAYLSAARWKGARAFFFSGLSLAAALLVRNSLVFNGIGLAYFLLKEHWPGRHSLRPLLKPIAAGLAPLIVAGLLFAAYNYARFGSPTELGLDYHRMSNRFLAEYQQFGVFSLHYLKENLYYQFIFYPLPLNDDTSFMGGSLFLLSPLFFAAFWSFQARASRLSAGALFLTILVVEIPILLLMGTGWVTFGPRYTLDFLVPLLLLTALGMRRWPPAAVALTLLVSIAHYTLGAWISLP